MMKRVSIARLKSYSKLIIFVSFLGLPSVYAKENPFNNRIRCNDDSARKCLDLKVGNWCENKINPFTRKREIKVCKYDGTATLEGNYWTAECYCSKN